MKILKSILSIFKKPIIPYADAVRKRTLLNSTSIAKYDNVRHNWVQYITPHKNNRGATNWGCIAVVLFGILSVTLIIIIILF